MRENAMDKLLYESGAFCEIKYASSIVCTGNILKVEHNRIYLDRLHTFIKMGNFDGTISLLSQVRGLQVFKTHVLSINDGYIVFDGLKRIFDTDRRLYQRVPAGIPAVITTESEPDVKYDAIIQDISVGGVLISGHMSFSVDETFTLYFQLVISGKQYILAVPSIVVRCVGSTNYSMRQYGCSFVGLLPDDRKLVESFVTGIRTSQIKQMFQK